MVNDHNYDVIEFPIAKKDYCQMEQKNNICINIFRYENDLIYPVYVSNKKNWKLYGFIVDNRWK